jgi:hypothetical protein
MRSLHSLIRRRDPPRVEAWERGKNAAGGLGFGRHSEIGDLGET